MTPCVENSRCLQRPLQIASKYSNPLNIEAISLHPVRVLVPEAIHGCDRPYPLVVTVAIALVIENWSVVMAARRNSQNRIASGSVETGGHMVLAPQFLTLSKSETNS